MGGADLMEVKGEIALPEKIQGEMEVGGDLSSCLK